MLQMRETDGAASYRCGDPNIDASDSMSEDSETKSVPHQSRGSSSQPQAHAVQMIAGARRSPARKLTGGDSRGSDGEKTQSPSQSPIRRTKRIRRAPSVLIQSCTSSAASSSRAPSSSSSSTTTPCAINQRSAFNSLMQRDPLFKMLSAACKSRWSKKFSKRHQKQPDTTVIDHKVDVEVRTRWREGAEQWDMQWKKSGATSFDLNYIVGTGERQLGDEMADDLLLKFPDYPIPSWEVLCAMGDFKSAATEGLRIRLQDLDFIEHRLRAQYGDAKFERMYPNRYLKVEEGEGRGGYVKNSRSRYHNRLRAIESRWKYECDRAGLPPVYIEDWTREPMDDTSLDLLKYICYLHKSDEVKEMLKDFRQLKGLRCEEGCGTCSRSPGVKHCCRKKVAIDIDEQTGQFKWCDEGVAKPSRMNFECTRHCGCGSECKNKCVQNGRQAVLCVFREPGKGWGVRTVQELDNGAFVSEYIGEVNKSGESGDHSRYDFDMGDHPIDAAGRKLKKLVISAGRMGNEARFFNHACSPNMKTVLTVVERYGTFYHHVAFYANRIIMPGEELMFDYFPDEDATSTYTGNMFDFCRCGSSKCRFPEGSAALSRRHLVKDEDDGAMADESDREMDKTLVASAPPSSRRRRRSTRTSDGRRSSMVESEEEKGERKRREQRRKTAEERRKTKALTDWTDSSDDYEDEEEMKKEEEKKVVKRKRSGQESPEKKQVKRRRVGWILVTDEEEEEEESDDERQKKKRKRKRSSAKVSIGKEVKKERGLHDSSGEDEEKRKEEKENVDEKRTEEQQENPIAQDGDMEADSSQRESQSPVQTQSHPETSDPSEEAAAGPPVSSQLFRQWSALRVTSSEQQCQQQETE